MPRRGNDEENRRKGFYGLTGVTYDLPVALLRCPACGAPFSRRESSLVCESGHCFDVARKGYVNLAPGRALDALYTRPLFESRRRVLESGAYAPVVETLSRLAARYAPDDALLVDAGCGDGFYAKALATQFRRVVAFDLARDAVYLAASGPKDERAQRVAFLVADLTRIPVQDGAASVLLDVFTPAHYAEFARVLKPGGVLIKALPGPGYLREIRALAGQRDYRNDDVLRRLDETGGERFLPLARETLFYTFPLPEPLRADAVRMTPLTHAHAASPDALTEITIEMEIAVLGKRE